MQVLNVYGSHWISVSNIGCPTGTVNIYDSLPNCALYSCTKKQVASILFSTCKKINVNFVDVQVQSGCSDCGLFPLAFSTSLCAGEDPAICSASFGHTWFIAWRITILRKGVGKRKAVFVTPPFLMCIAYADYHKVEIWYHVPSVKNGTMRTATVNIYLN